MCTFNRKPTTSLSPGVAGLAPSVDTHSWAMTFNRAVQCYIRSSTPCCIRLLKNVRKHRIMHPQDKGDRHIALDASFELSTKCQIITSSRIRIFGIYFYSWGTLQLWPKFSTSKREGDFVPYAQQAWTTAAKRNVTCVRLSRPDSLVGCMKSAIAPTQSRSCMRGGWTSGQQKRHYETRYSV